MVKRGRVMVKRKGRRGAGLRDMMERLMEKARGLSEVVVKVVRVVVKEMLIWRTLMMSH
jgi:hypothetical protein